MDAATITAAGLETLDETGLEKLTMRAVADRLGVRVGGLYYYVADKSALLRAMADLLCRRMLVATRSDATTSGDAPVLALCEGVRGVLRGHRDGARLFAAAPMNGSVGALELMERLVALLESDARIRSANVAADTLMSYITGYVLQEQVPPAPDAWAGTTREALVARFPLVMRDTDDDNDRVFRASLEAILHGFDVTSRPAPTGSALDRPVVEP